MNYDVNVMEAHPGHNCQKLII